MERHRLERFGVGVNLKSTSGWNSDVNGIDLYGFADLPGGARNLNGEFADLGEECFFWVSNENNTISSWERMMNYFRYEVNRNYKNKPFGLSVRCVKN